MTHGKEFHITLIVRCRPDMINHLIDELHACVDYENEKILDYQFHQIADEEKQSNEK